jgi:hypothetical protein
MPTKQPLFSIKPCLSDACWTLNYSPFPDRKRDLVITLSVPVPCRQFTASVACLEPIFFFSVCNPCRRGAAITATLQEYPVRRWNLSRLAA